MSPEVADVNRLAEKSPKSRLCLPFVRDGVASLGALAA
jgi:hypothetical protein